MSIDLNAWYTMHYNQKLHIMIEQILIQQNPHWDNTPYKGLIQRTILPALVAKLQAQEIQILLGIRRSGKSTLFRLLINVLMQTEDPKNIVYINFDDPTFIDVYGHAKHIYDVIDIAQKITGTKVTYLFLDEIQNVQGWERFVKSVYDSSVYKKIFVTGSNASLLDSSYASLLTGRYLKDRIHPLCLQEIFEKEAIHDACTLFSNKSKVLKILEQALEYGLFPGVCLQKDYTIKRELLTTYYDAILYKDCIKNHEIRDTYTFEKLAHYLISNPGMLYSYKSLANFLECSDLTVKEFIRVLQSSFLLYEIHNFSYSLKNQAKSKKKVYIADPGIIHALGFQFSENRGSLLENMVFNEIKKSGVEEVYYFHDLYECDFILKQGTTNIAMQVTSELSLKNREREVRGLRHAMSALHCKEGYIITFNYEETIDEHIQVLPIWKYFGLKRDPVKA